MSRLGWPVGCSGVCVKKALQFLCACPPWTDSFEKHGGQTGLHPLAHSGRGLAAGAELGENRKLTAPSRPPAWVSAAQALELSARAGSWTPRWNQGCSLALWEAAAPTGALTAASGVHSFVRAGALVLCLGECLTCWSHCWNDPKQQGVIRHTRGPAMQNSHQN